VHTRVKQRRIFAVEFGLNKFVVSIKRSTITRKTGNHRAKTTFIRSIEISNPEIGVANVLLFQMLPDRVSSKTR
jgi:hypothetical protein